MRKSPRLLVWLLLWLFAGQSLLVQAAVPHRMMAQPMQAAIAMQMAGHHHHTVDMAAAVETASSTHPACAHDCHCVDAHCAAVATALPRAALPALSLHPSDAPRAMGTLARAFAGYAGDLLRPPSYT